MSIAGPLKQSEAARGETFLLLGLFLLGLLRLLVGANGHLRALLVYTLMAASCEKFSQNAASSPEIDLNSIVCISVEELW